MRRSKGRMAKKSRILGRKTRKHKVTPAEIVRELLVGSKVQIVPKGQFEDFPHMRYAGRVGKIVDKKGNAYVVEVKDGNKIKKIIASPVHLKSIKR